MYIGNDKRNVPEVIEKFKNHCVKDLFFENWRKI